MLISHDNEESAFNPVQILILSLFLQLLVFFILMNSISLFEQAKERMKLIRGSVAGQELPLLGGSSIFPGMGSSVSASGTAESPEDTVARFAHEIPGLTDKPVRRAGILEMQMAGSEMNRLLGLAPGSSVDERLLQMIRFITAPEHRGTTVVLIKTIRPEIYAQGVQDNEPTLYALHLWTAALKRAGVPDEMLRIGVGPGRAGGVILRLETKIQKKEDSAVPTPSSGPANIAPQPEGVAPKGEGGGDDRQ